MVYIIPKANQKKKIQSILKENQANIPRSLYKEHAATGQNDASS